MRLRFSLEINGIYTHTMLADVDKLDTKTWCQCTTGYSKVLFEKAFNCQVDVELFKSVKMGDSNCLMKIELRSHA